MPMNCARRNVASKIIVITTLCFMTEVKKESLYNYGSKNF